MTRGTVCSSIFEKFQIFSTMIESAGIGSGKSPDESRSKLSPCLEIGNSIFPSGSEPADVFHIIVENSCATPIRCDESALSRTLTLVLSLLRRRSSLFLLGATSGVEASRTKTRVIPCSFSSCCPRRGCSVPLAPLTETFNLRFADSPRKQHRYFPIYSK